MRKILVIGCGMRKLKDTEEDKYIGVDIRKFKGVDYVLDIGKDKFPFENDYFDEIIAENVFEHLGWNDKEDYFINCMEECFKVLKPKGYITFSVPHFPSSLALIHPEHRRFFVKDSFSFFQVPAEGIDPQGYLKGFWHVNINDYLTDKNMIFGRLYPNKLNGKYPYKKIRKKDE